MNDAGSAGPPRAQPFRAEHHSNAGGSYDAALPLETDRL